MNYKELVSVTGIGGLFQLLTTKSDGAIVRNISDKSTKFISARLHNVTPLESIEVYTTGDNVRLHEVFQKMKDAEATNAPVDAKAGNNDIKAYFSGIFPDFDQDRVYVSDMKKMLKWYQMLKENDLLNFDNMNQEAEEEEEKAEAATETPAEEEKPAKKATKKKAAPKADDETEEEKPAKKATKKKAAPKADGEAKPAAKKAAKKKTEE
ncbi:MAG: DUF5606 domain-containing protein [Chitinophagaceae bacterium]|nr:DUF5606 domain-containing protein [Chitinophagaceae bacterium]MCB9044767.1 DUF5606 domain-containing protein [Chitinophagales bacterium]